MKLRKDSYEIKTNKINNDKKIILMADLHLNLQMNKKIMELIQDFLDKNKKPNLIAIPGDIMYAWQYKNPKYIKKLEYILTAMREIAPVALSLGNHDLYKMTDEERKIFNNLNKMKDIYALDNEQIKIDEMTITGFSPEHAAYDLNNHGIEANKIFVKNFNASNLTFNNDELNILLNHAPHPIASAYAREMLKEIYNKVDLIVAGHLHNGYVPDKIEEKFKIILGDYGIWEKINLTPPQLFSKIRLCRGEHDLGHAKLIITKGVRMYTGYVPACIPIDPHITEIDVKKTR